MNINSLKTKDSFHNYVTIKQSDNTSSIEVLLCDSKGALISNLNEDCTVSIYDAISKEVRQISEEKIVNGVLSFKIVNDLFPYTHKLEVTTYSGVKFPADDDFQIFVSESHSNKLLNVIRAIPTELALKVVTQQVMDRFNTADEKFNVLKQMLEVKMESIFTNLESFTKKGEVSVFDIDKNKGLLDASFFSASFLEQLKAGVINATVLNDGSVTTPKLANFSVVPEKTSFIESSKNLVVIDDLIQGKYIYPNSNGMTIDYLDSPSYSATPYIPVTKAGSIYKNRPGAIAFSDSNFKKLFYSNSSTPAGSFQIPPGTAYVNTSFLKSDINAYQLEYGTQETSYVKGGHSLRSVNVNNSSIVDVDGNKILPFTLPFKNLGGMTKSNNCLNPQKLIDNGYIDRATGKVVFDIGNYYYDYLPVLGKKIRVTPVSSGVINIAYYNTSRQITGNSQVKPGTQNYFDVPLDSVEYRVSISKDARPDKIMVYFSEVEMQYDDYFLYPVDLVFPKTTDKSKLSVSISSDKLSVRVPQKDDKAIEYSMFNEILPYSDGGTYQNGNTWRINGCDLVTVSNGNVTERSKITNSGAWECAIEIEGYPDFIGTMHGYEKFDSVQFYINKVKVGTGNYSCDEFSMLYKSKLFEQGSQSTVVAEVIRHYVFNKGGLKLKQRYVFKKSYSKVLNAYVTMLPILRTGVTHTAFDDSDYTEYDVSTTNFSIINAQHDNVSEAHIYGDNVGSTVKVNFKDKDKTNKFNVSNSSTYNKLYFSYNTGQSINSGDEWEIDAEYAIESR